MAIYSGFFPFKIVIFHSYPLVNKQLDPENHLFLMETSLPTPICQGRTVYLPEGMIYRCFFSSLVILGGLGIFFWIFGGFTGEL